MKILENMRTIETTVSATMDDKDFALINKEFTNALAQNLEGKSEADAEIISKELARRQELAITDKLEELMTEELGHELLDHNGYLKLTDDQLIGRQIYVNRNNPSTIAIKSGINISQVTVTGSIYHLLRKFAKQGTLWMGELDSEFKNSIVTNLGLKLVQSKRNKAVDGNFNAVGARIDQSTNTDVLTIRVFQRFAKEAQVASVSEQFTFDEAKAIIDNFEAFEKALGDQVEKEEN